MSGCVKLGDYFHMQSGGTPKRTEPSFYGGDIPWAKIGDMNTSTALVTETEETITEAGLAAIGGRIVAKGSLMFAMYGASIGKMAFAGKDLSCNQAILGIRPKDKDQGDVKYLYYMLRSRLQNLISDGKGGAQPNLSASYLRDYKAFIPPIEEQRRIAAILDKADAIRQKRKSALTLLERQIHSLFIHSMGPQSPDYQKWPLMKVSELAEKSKGAMRTGPFGSDLKHSEFVDQGVAVLGIDNAVQNKFAWGERRYITSEKYEKLKRYTVKPDDVIVTIMGTTGRSAVVPSDIPTAITTKHLATITLDKTKAEPEFISNAIHRHPSVLSQIKQQNKGAIMAGLNLGIIKDLQIPLPPINTQQAFVCELKKLRRLENKMMTALEQAETLFASLSQRAFKGEL